MRYRLAFLVVSILLGVLLGSCTSGDSPQASDDPLNTPQNLPLKSPAEEAAFLDAMEAYYAGFGITIEQSGFTREEFLAESYRWCAMIQAVGHTQAYETLRSEVGRLYPPDEVELQYAFTASGNRIIEDHLCN